MKTEPKVICICGSSRFIEEMAVWAWEAEKQNIITHRMHLLPHWYKTKAPDHMAEVEGVAEQMD